MRGGPYNHIDTNCLRGMRLASVGMRMRETRMTRKTELLVMAILSFLCVCGFFSAVKTHTGLQEACFELNTLRAGVLTGQYKIQGDAMRKVIIHGGKGTAEEEESWPYRPQQMRRVSWFTRFVAWIFNATGRM